MSSCGTTDADGLRLTCFATNTTVLPVAALELRHRRRARAEDRIRAARTTGLRNLPLHDTLRFGLLSAAAQIVTTARRRYLPSRPLQPEPHDVNCRSRTPLERHR